MERKELESFLNKTLEVDLYRDYGPNGLQVEGRDQISKIAFAVSATVDSIEHSIKWGADALVTHHGIFWDYMGAKPITREFAKRVKPLVKKDINLFSYHLPLDGHKEYGNAAQLAKELGLIGLQPFGDYKGMPTGVKAKFTSPIKVSDFATQLEKTLKRKPTLATPSDSQEIETIGIITGGANNSWDLSLKEGLDAFLTGEISEYNWHDAIEAGIHYFACGHHATERYGVLALQKLIDEKFPKLETKFFDSPNPV